MNNIITQFGISGISIILDKSAFQSFSEEDMNCLCRYYRLNITPILVMEILGDLKKDTEENDLNKKEVALFSNKLSTLNTSVNSHFSILMSAEMAGMKIPFLYPVIDTGETVQTQDGKKGILVNPSSERNSLERWKEGNFKKIEELYSKFWREETLNPKTIHNLKDNLRKRNPQLNKLKDPDNIIVLIKSAFANPELSADILKSAIEEFKLPYPGQIFYRWETSKQDNLFVFAPYTMFCLMSKLFFNICLQNNIIGTRATNLIDLEYIYYLPFCRVFVSNDSLHKKLVPHLLRVDQEFVLGEDLKNDFKRIEEIKLTLLGKDLQRTHSEPPRNEELLSYKIWKKMHVDWPPEKDWEPTPEEKEMVHRMVRDFSDAIKNRS